MGSLSELMRDQWDAIARRNAFYGVASWPEFQALDQVDREKFWATGQREVDEFLGRLPLGDTRSRSMVEIGCGLGRMTHRFAERFGRVYAVDVSPEMLAQAKAQWTALRNVEFILGQGNNLPGITARSIDFVFSYIVLQHVPDPAVVKDYIRETARVLRPGGLAYLQLRTEAPAHSTRSSLVRQAVRAAIHARSVLRAAIGPLCARLSLPRWRGVSSLCPLADEFGRFESWRGCALRVEEVETFAIAVGLRTEQVVGVGTQYTFCTFRRL